MNQSFTTLKELHTRILEDKKRDIELQRQRKLKELTRDHGDFLDQWINDHPGYTIPVNFLKKVKS